MKAPILAAVLLAMAGPFAGTAFAQQSESTTLNSTGPGTTGSGSGGAAGPDSWYAIAASSTSQGAAQQRASALGSGWFVMSSNECPNFRGGLWVTVSGPFSHSDALTHVNNAKRSGVYDAYAKSCR